VICLRNFGDEIAIMELVNEAKLDVPILLQANYDEIDKADVASRRDAFCGKFSVANNFYQHGVPFTDTTNHTCDVDDAPLRSRSGLSTTAAWRRSGEIAYALEGNISVSAQAAAWMAELMGLPDVEALTALAAKASGDSEVCLAPAHRGRRNVRPRQGLTVPPRQQEGRRNGRRRPQGSRRPAERRTL